MSWMDDYDKAGGWKGQQPGKPWTGKSKAANWKRCWEENHKPLEIGGGTVLGAACAYPAEGYDIYIGFDHGMKFKNHRWPWVAGSDAVVEFLYPITDMAAPKSPKDFKAMIDWMQKELAKGKKIHMGCIGGHGRTGLVIAALVAQINGEKDAIQWTRKNHCHKGVESTSQVKFLMKHYGVSKAEPTKQSYKATQTGSKKHQGQTHTIYNGGLGDTHVEPVKSKGSIW